MKKSTTFLFSLIIMFSSQVFADRPGLEDRQAPSMTQPDTTPAPAMQTEMQQTTGDALEIGEGETIDIKKLDFPRRGMSMKKVLTTLGKPVRTVDAVGEPPIRQWIYDDRTIYFENMTVIHVVAKP